MKLKYFIVIIVYSFVNLKAGEPFVTRNKDIFGTRVFVENKGQFNSSVPTKEKIECAFENGDEKIYFTNKGLVYKLEKKVGLSEAEREEIENGNTSEEKDEIYYVNMNWINSNPNIQIARAEKTNYYFTYGSADLNSYGYKKITYKNVYNGIDVEYIIPSDKEYGIKYNVILHPGANPSDIKIVYSGDITKIEKSGKDVIIKTPSENITEHAPKSFYENKESVATEFILSGNTINFNFPEGFDPNKTLIIDPWVTTLTSMLNNNCGYDVDYDNQGNLFVYGGNNDFKIGKYNATGVLLWTFSGNIVTPAWNAGTYAGNFVVDKFTGKCYTGQGFNPGGTRVVRLDPLGNYDNFISVLNDSLRELWDMSQACSGAIHMYGGSTSSPFSGGLLNTSNGNVSLKSFVPSYTLTCCEDIVCPAMDDNNNLFVIYASASGPINNKLAQINSALTNTVWMAPSNYNSFAEAANKGSYIGGGMSSNGFNCLAVNNNYLYYYDGFNLAAYNKASGSQVGATFISGFIIKQQGGIAVDDCDNIYLGGNNDSIISYNFNGSVFNQLPSIKINSGTTVTSTYDVKLDKGNKLLYFCGSGFVGVLSAVNSNTCNSNSCFVNTGIKQSVEKEGTVHVIPNPTTGEFTISLNKISEYTYGEIYNCLGQIVIRKPLVETNTKINLSEQTNGIYFVRINGLDYTTKIIKE